MLNLLRNGNDMTCPNYKCTTKDVFTCDTGIEYLQHAVSCRPLYQCAYCGTETKYESYLKKHMITCKGEIIEVNRNIKEENNEKSPEMFVKKREDCAGKIIKKYTVINKVKKVKFGKQMKNNTNVRKNMSLRKRASHTYKETIVKCESSNPNEANIKTYKRKAGGVQGKNKEISSSNESYELQTTHDSVDNSFTDEKSPEISLHNKTSESSPKVPNHKTYLQNTIKKKVLQSMSEQLAAIGKSETKNKSKVEKKIKQYEVR